MEYEEMPSAPVTAEELVARWAARDAEYAKMRTPLDPNAIIAIRNGRMTEAGLLADVAQRAKLWARAQAWTQPTHQEFGGLRDWLDD